MPKLGGIWKKVQTRVNASDILAPSIKLWFKNTVDKPRTPELTIYQRARQSTSGGSPRFGHLHIDIQRLLKREVREQYPTLPSDDETEQIIETAFDMIFKGKYQYDMEKERKSQAKPADNEPSCEYSTPQAFSSVLKRSQTLTNTYYASIREYCESQRYTELA